MAKVEYTSERAREIARAHSRGRDANAIEALKDARRIGLSVGHTSPRVYAIVAPRGSYMAIRESGKRPPRTMPTARGRVCGFSRRSRSRMMQKCAMVDRSAHAGALFVTLTYPSSWPTTSDGWKRHLDTFWKRCQRTYPRLSAIWKLEFQARGAPHFHLLVFGQRFIPAAWIARAWYEVVASGDTNHLRAGVQVVRVRSARMAISYVAKYMAKVEAPGDDDAHVGRIWGVLGRKYLPLHCVEWRLDESGASALFGIVRQLLRSRGLRFDDAHPPPRWVIMDGSRAMAAVRWADSLSFGADPLS